MDEHVLSTVVANDEAEALLRIEEFDDAFAFANDLGRHSASATAAKAAATAAAKTTAAAAATAEAAAVTKVTAAATEAAAVAVTTATTATGVAAAFLVAEFSADILFAETVALIAAAPTAVALAPSIETHAPSELKEPAYPRNQRARAKWRGRSMARKTTHAPGTPLQEKFGRL
jgi:hypothetical protein